MKPPSVSSALKSSSSPKRVDDGWRLSTAPTPPASTAGLPQSRFVALDGLRGIAALAVVLYHVQAPAGAMWLAPHGFLAVDFFFALSGFVIAHAYRMRLETGETSPAWFFVRRFARLWPSAMLGTAIGVAAVLLGRSELTPAETSSGRAIALLAVLALAFAPRLGSSIAYPLNPPMWSLFDELAANLIYAAGVYRLRVPALAAATFAAAIATTTALVLGVGGSTLLRALYPYFAGALIYELRTAKVTAPPVPPLVAALAVVAAFFVPENSSRTIEVGFRACFVLVACPLAVWSAAEMELPRAGDRIARAAGDASYPLYSIHYPALLIATAGAPNSLSLAAAAGLVGLLAFAAVGVARYYDAPLRRVLLGPRRATLTALGRFKVRRHL